MTTLQPTLSVTETNSLHQERLEHFLDIKISMWLSTILENNEEKISDEAYMQEMRKFFGNTKLPADLEQQLAQVTKIILLQKCNHLLNKEEQKRYSQDMSWEEKDFIAYIETKVAKQKHFEELEKNIDFKAYSTTTLLAQKMCSEFGITNAEHKKAPLLQSYIAATRPANIPEEKWIQLDESFFEEVEKQKNAKNPLTFIDITHSETSRENPIHIKMWLYILTSRKDRKSNTFFFTVRDNDIQSFTMKDEGYRLFERVFNAGCQLHRNLINDPLEQQYIYTVHSMDDIQQILLGSYQQPGKPPIGAIEKQNLDGFINVTECLFHIGSHRLRGKSGKKSEDQFAHLVEKPRNFSNKDAWKELFDLQPFRSQVVDKFKEQVGHFGLIIDDRSGTKLTSENFMRYVDLGTMKRTIPVKDEYANKFLFSGRCKELDSIVNKMLNTPKYSHIDAFNDILGTRFEVIHTNKKLTGPDVLGGLLKRFMHTGKDNPNFKYYSLKGDYAKNKNAFEEPERANKLKKTPSENGLVNTKTSSGYNEVKLIFKEFEVQMIEQGNNTTGSKDDAPYAFKKIQDILRRNMQSISLNDINISSMNRWIRTVVTKKRYKLIAEKVSHTKKHKELMDSDLIHDLCTIQLVHEMLLEELTRQNNTIKATSILYIFAKEALAVTNNIGQEFFQAFEEKYTTDEGFMVSYEQLQHDTSPIGRGLIQFISTAADSVSLYTLFDTLKKKSRIQNNDSLVALDRGTLTPIQQQQFDTLTAEWVKKEKNLIEQNINQLYTTIGGASYSGKVNELIKKLDAGEDGMKLAKWIFWDALFDKKQKETNSNNNIWIRGKKVFKFFSLGFVSQLQTLLSASGTFTNMYPELNNHLDRYKQVHNFTEQSNLDFYKQGKSDFEKNVTSPSAAFYQDIVTNIQKSSIYHQYTRLINLYLQVYIESEISKQAERSFIDENKNSWVAKIKPAKVARLNKMYIKWTSLQESFPETANEKL